ncbi:hypothetical protein ABGB07_36445 [Micromonosporaceae bacterium B7E4]
MRKTLYRISLGAGILVATLGLVGGPASATPANTTTTSTMASAAASCSVASVTMNVSNYGAATNFYVWCTAPHRILSTLAFYNSAGDVIYLSSSQTGIIQPGSWTPAFANATFPWLPVVGACIWIDQDNPPTVQLYSACFPRNQ